MFSVSKGRERPRDMEKMIRPTLRVICGSAAVYISAIQRSVDTPGHLHALAIPKPNTEHGLEGQSLDNSTTLDSIICTAMILMYFLISAASRRVGICRSK